MLDLSKIDIDEQGKLTGIEEQLAGLKSNNETAYLFEVEKNNFRGVQVGKTDNNKPDTKDMSYEELCAYLEQE